MPSIRLVTLLCSFLLFGAAVAQNASQLSDQALVAALRAGGYNIYFRHAATEWSQQDKVNAEGDWSSCDPAKIRQLSDAGRQTAAAIGEAILALQIPIGRVLASPYCRTLETARRMQVGDVETSTDIMNMRVASYFGGTEAIAESARQRLSAPPEDGTNSILVAHGNVLISATGVYPQEAEGIVFQPDGNGSYSVAARISPEQWTRLASVYGNRP
jgi:phosphohistidine phosphatase SixA